MAWTKHMPRKLSKAEHAVLDVYRTRSKERTPVVVAETELAALTGYSRSYVKEARHYLLMRGMLRIVGHHYSKPMRIEVVQ